MTVPTSRRPASWLLAAVLAFAPATGVFAQDEPVTSADGRADVEDRARVEFLVKSLGNRGVWGVPRVLRERIDGLVSSGHPLAIESLRSILADTGARTVVVGEIIHAVLVDRTALELVDDVVERLRIERGSELGSSFDDELMRYADVALVRRVAALARDTERSSGYRATAALMLGRTRHDAALPALVELWGDEDAKVRTAASRAFVAIVPGVDSRADAQALLDEMAERDLPLSEVLRRRLRVAYAERDDDDTPRESYESDYRALARSALSAVAFEDVLALYLRSPLPDLRMAGAERLRTFPFDGLEDPGGAKIAAAKSLLLALRTERLDAVESALLAALQPLAEAVTENVDGDDLDALTARVRVEGSASPEVWRAAVDFLTALGDPRALRVLEAEFEVLGDTARDMRIELIDALAACNGDLTGWLLARVLDEPDVGVMQHMVVKLGTDPDPAALDVFEALLSRTDADGTREFDVLSRSYVVSALGQLWTLRGSERARDVLIEFGLRDPTIAVRETSAAGLATPRPGDPEPAVAALSRVARDAGETENVRKVATRGVLELASTSALRRLGDAIDDPIVWEVFRVRRTEELRGGHTEIDDVLVEAETLWAGDREERAIELLRAVVEAGTGLWEGRAGRGLVRESLVERLLEEGRPSDACVFAEALVAEPPRTDDPVHRWRLLLARSLRACGQGDRLRRSVDELVRLRGDEALPAPLAPHVLTELGEAYLQLEDPTAARDVLESIPADTPAFDEAQRARAQELLARAVAESEEERTEVLALVAAVGDEPAARERLAAMKHRAARHIDSALSGITDATAARPLLTAAGILTDEVFGLAADATPEQVAEMIGRARIGLARVLAAAASSGSR